MSVMPNSEQQQHRNIRRKRKPRRPSWIKNSFGLLKLAVLILITIKVISWTVSFVGIPISLCSSEGREAQRVKQDYLALKKENAQMERKIKYIKTPEGVTKAARKIGYVKPGEVTIIIPDTDNKH